MNHFKYHITKTSNVNSILSDGLKPMIGNNRKKCKYDWERNSVDLRISMCDKKDILKWKKALYKDDLGISVLKVQIDGLPLKKRQWYHGYEYACCERISSDRIKIFMYDKSMVKQAKNYKQFIKITRKYWKRFWRNPRRYSLGIYACYDITEEYQVKEVLKHSKWCTPVMESILKEFLEYKDCLVLSDYAVGILRGVQETNEDLYWILEDCNGECAYGSCIGRLETLDPDVFEKEADNKDLKDILEKFKAKEHEIVVNKIKFEK